MPYTTFLETLMDGQAVDKTGKKVAPTIKDFTSISTEVTVDFTVVFPKGRLAELEATQDANGCNGVEKTLKLFTTVSTTNMHMFNAACRLHKYGSVQEIIREFYALRLAVYGKRKAAMIIEMERRLVKLSNRARYIQETLTGTIDLRRKTAGQVDELLTGMSFVKLDGDYKYLVKMPMDSVTQENVDAILKEKGETKQSLDTLVGTPIEQMWIRELDAFLEVYTKYKSDRAQAAKQEVNTAKPTAKVIKRAPKNVGK
jgi:DNA topoisomerase-2